MTESEPRFANHVERWVSVATTVLAPATVLSALLFYFGYVSSRAQFLYFGVDVDTIGLSTRDYVMRSPQALLVPALVFALGGAGLLLAHIAIRSRVRLVHAGLGDQTLPDAERDAWSARATSLQQTIRRALLTGVVLLAAGLMLLFAYPLVDGWQPYGVVTPLLIAAGAALAAYAWRLPGTADQPPPDADDALLRTAALALTCAVIATCMFWATATVAQWSGRGAAMRIARSLDDLPAVILDTQERLLLTDGVTQESALQESPGQTFRYRYRGLRLLIQGDGRLFLVPQVWSPSDSTVVVPLDETVRIRFQFVNQRP